MWVEFSLRYVYNQYTLYFVNKVLTLFIIFPSHLYQTAYLNIMDTDVKKLAQGIAWTTQFAILLMEHAVKVVKLDT